MLPLRNIAARRGYAVIDASRSALTFSVKKSLPASAPAIVKTVSKAGGITVATLEDGGPVSRLALVVKGGSRYEPSAGVAHVLKSFAFAETTDATSLKTVREAEMRGNTLYSTVGREELVLGSEFLRDDLEDALPTLLASVSNALYNHYDFGYIASLALEESKAALADPTTSVLDAVHGVAFRTGLGNSVFASPVTAKKLSVDSVKAFAQQAFTPANMAIVGSGVAHADLVSLIESLSGSLSLGHGAVSASPSAYFGGEVRIPSTGESHYVIAGESVSFSSSDHATVLVLKHLLGSGFEPSVKYADPSTFHAPLAKISGKGVKASAFTHAYSDAGIFGIHVTSEKTAPVKAAVEAAVGAIKAASAGEFAADDLIRARKGAVLEVEAGGMGAELAQAGRQVLATGGVAGSVELVEKIGKVTVEDVKRVTSKIVKSRASVVAMGNLREIPFADQLSL